MLIMFENWATQNDALIMYWIFALAVVMEIVFTIQNIQLKWRNSSIAPLDKNNAANRLNLPKELWAGGFLERATFGSVSHRATFILHNSLDGTLLNYTAKRIQKCIYMTVNVSSSSSSLHQGDKIFASAEEDDDTFTSVLWTANIKGAAILIEPAYSYPLRKIYPSSTTVATTTSATLVPDENILILPDYYKPDQQENPIQVYDTMPLTSTTFQTTKTSIIRIQPFPSTKSSSTYDSESSSTASTTSSLVYALKTIPTTFEPPINQRQHHTFRPKFGYHRSTEGANTITEAPGAHRRTHHPKHHSHHSQKQLEPEISPSFSQYDPGLQESPRMDPGTFNGRQQVNDYGFYENNQGQRFRRQAFYEDGTSTSQACPVDMTTIIWSYIWGIVAASPKSARELHRYQIKDFYGRCLISGGQFSICSPQSLSTLWDVFKVNLTHRDDKVMF